MRERAGSSAASAIARRQVTFFESLLALLLAAIVLLQLSRRLSLPYPAMLAAAGVCVALIPGVPAIRIDPHTALALFIAPVLLDAAFDFPVGTVRTLWRPLFALAVLAVLLTTAVVAWLGWYWAGLPLAAAIALGAIVAPPDAAAATAVLSTVSLPRRTVAVLKGESLLNDATALLLFDGAVEVWSHGSFDGRIALHVVLAVPGGVLLGIVLAWGLMRVQRFVAGTLGGHLLEFVNTFWVWILAEWLRLSAVLCVVAFAMSVARDAALKTHPRARVHSYATWETGVFLLNVLAFLLKGMQARIIVGEMQPGRFAETVGFAAVVTVTVVGTRLLWVLAVNRMTNRFGVLRGDLEPPTLRQGLVAGWAGTRGLVTLVTALALPAGFPQRDMIVLAAFAVVLATLVVQGATLVPIIRWLGLDHDDGVADELRAARQRLAATAIAALEAEPGAEAERLRAHYRLVADSEATGDAPLERHRTLGLTAIRAARECLAEMRLHQDIDPEVFEKLQEELDWKELATISEDERRIEPS